MRTKHQRADRAKIFQPFDSLKGFKELLKAKERIVVEKKELSEDDYQELDRKFKLIQIGMIIKVIYYEDGEYIAKEGMISKIDSELKRTIQIVEKEIKLDDILDIEF